MQYLMIYNTYIENIVMPLAIYSACQYKKSVLTALGLLRMSDIESKMMHNLYDFIHNWNVSN
jgi:hypothetical protein